MVMAASYGMPHPVLFERSFGTYWSAHFKQTLHVFEVRFIESVVMMAPDTQYPYRDGTEGDRWYMMQKPGRKLCSLLDTHEEDIN